MSEFTPGPWTARGHSVVALAESHTLGRGHTVIAMTSGPNIGVRNFRESVQVGLMNETLEANALLIAAAPELFDALNMLLRDTSGGPPETRKRAYVAIAKALGQSTGPYDAFDKVQGK